jgi:hypothetical protein
MQLRLVISQRKGKQTLFRVGYSLPEELSSVSNCAIIHDTVNYAYNTMPFITVFSSCLATLIKDHGFVTT